MLVLGGHEGGMLFDGVEVAIRRDPAFVPVSPLRLESSRGGGSKAVGFLVGLVGAVGFEDGAIQFPLGEPDDGLLDDLRPHLHHLFVTSLPVENNVLLDRLVDGNDLPVVGFGKAQQFSELTLGFFRVGFSIGQGFLELLQPVDGFIDRDRIVVAIGLLDLENVLGCAGRPLERPERGAAPAPGSSIVVRLREPLPPLRI